MRCAISTAGVWVLLRVTRARDDDTGGVTDETLITAAMILAAAAFLGFVTWKVVPWIKDLDLPVVG